MVARGARGDLTGLLAGAVFPLAFAPLRWFPLGVICLAVLYTLWLGSGPRRAAWRGFLFGLGAFGVGVSWVYVSLHNFGNMPAPMAAVAVAGFVMLLAAFPAAAGWAQGAMGGAAGPVCRLAMIMPAAWVTAEWLREWVLTGFPWLLAGYSQSDWWPADVAAWLGVYGVSLVTAIVSGLLVSVLGLPGRRLRGIVLAAALLAACAIAGRVSWVRSVGEPIDVALVQGNVPLGDKWSGERTRLVDRYLSMSAALVDRDLIVWPESALPYYYDELPPVFWEALRSHPADFLLGVLERDARDEVFYNSVVAVTDQQAFYRKRHLVPFGEFLPLKFLFGWVVDYLEIPMADFTSWPDRQLPLTAAGWPLGVSVCYEDAFALEIRRALPQAAILVNVSEDAWFGNSLAPHQRLQMAQLRAIESGRPFLRAANTGVSAVIDWHGRILSRSPQFETHVLTAAVQPMQGLTPFTRFGHVPLLAIVAGLWLAGLASVRAEKAKPADVSAENRLRP